MYHCHVSFHEDEGMMGQFVVTPPVASVPSMIISNNKLAEGNSGTKQMNFTVTLSSPGTQPVSVNYKTKKCFGNYTRRLYCLNGILTFAPETIKQSALPSPMVMQIAEANETFKVTLSNPNATLADASGKGTILNDDDALLNSNIVLAGKPVSSIKIFP